MHLGKYSAWVLASQIFRFCVTGAVGFFIDASILLALIHGFGMSPVLSRLFSFACAVAVTFEFNRRWTFKGPDKSSYLVMLSSYLGVQSVGFGCNFTVYVILSVWLPLSPWSPIVALAAASVIALSINYIGSRVVVFGRR